MRKLGVIIFLSFLLLLTACGGSSVEKGKKLTSQRKYAEAIKVFQKAIKKDETNYDAWFGTIKAQIKDDEYNDAEDTLKDLFSVIEENFDNDSNIDYEAVIEKYQDYADDIIRHEGSLGSWYTDLKPAPIDIFEFDYSIFEIGSSIELDVPKDVKVYYNFENKPVSKKDKLYKNKIEFAKEGSFTLTVAPVSKYGIKGDETYAWITVGELPTIPVLNKKAGTYTAPFTVKFTSFNSNKEAIYYTTDSSDPISNGLNYYPEDEIYLPAGETVLKAVLYNTETGFFSEVTTAKYIIEAATPPVPSKEGGTYNGTISIDFSGYNADDAEILYTLDGLDPINYGLYYNPAESIELTKGEYEIRAVILDYNCWDYSKEFRAKYIIN